jgi:hypothetical protein
LLFLIDFFSFVCGNGHTVTPIPQEKTMSKPRLPLPLCAAILAVAALGAITVHAQFATSAPPPVQATNAKPNVKPGATAPKVPPQNPSPESNTTTPPGQLATATSPAATVQTENFLKISLIPSEIPLKLGSNSNIAAEIQNVSNRPVIIETRSLQLLTHAIVTPSDSLCVMPLAGTSNSTIMLQPTLILLPQDHLTVFFNLSQQAFTAEQQDKLNAELQKEGSNPQPAASSSGTSVVSAPMTPYQRDLQAAYAKSCNPGTLGSIKRAFDFTPGNYEYFVSGRFAVCDMNALGPLCYYYPSRSFGQSATFQVGIDQTLIIIFAVVGGLLAYLVVTVRSADGPIGDFFSLVTSDKGLTGMGKALSREGLILLFMILRDALGVAILSAAFTIVASRLSDTQFPIKISVLDVWGAMTIGFLSYFVGNKFIDSLRDLVK